MGEERDGVERKTERVQKRKTERQCGRQEGNVTRQGGDMEHRITVYMCVTSVVLHACVVCDSLRSEAQAQDVSRV